MNRANVLHAAHSVKPHRCYAPQIWEKAYITAEGVARACCSGAWSLPPIALVRACVTVGAVRGRAYDNGCAVRRLSARTETEA